MFPEGFDLQSEGAGYRLVLNGRAIALATQIERGGCRLCLHTDLAEHMRFEFAPSMSAGVRYLERWVGSWEPELRELYSRPPPRAYFSG